MHMYTPLIKSYYYVKIQEMKQKLDYCGISIHKYFESPSASMPRGKDCARQMLNLCRNDWPAVWDRRTFFSLFVSDSHPYSFTYHYRIWDPPTFSSFQSATSWLTACVKGIRQLGTKLSLGLAGTLNDVIWHSAAAPRRNIFRETRGRVGPHLLQWFTNCLAAAVCVVALSCKRKRCTALF
jgi:hypothetical protein